MVATVPSTLTTQGMGGTDSSSELVGTGFVSTGKPGALRVVELYDTTLRDGTQMEGISASVNDKLKIARELHSFGAIHVIVVVFSFEYSYSSTTAVLR